MNTATSGTLEAAQALDGWFRAVLELCDQGLFNLPQDEKHRDAVILYVLTRNAKTLVEVPPDDEGRLYAPLCLALAGGCRALGIVPDPRNWKEAVEGVRRCVRSEPGPQGRSLGLDLGTPATIFRGLMTEALVKAGVTDSPTSLDPRNRKVSLGLGVNWGMRFLLAYAVEVRPRRSGRKASLRDLSWIRGLIAPFIHGRPV